MSKHYPLALSLPFVLAFAGVALADGPKDRGIEIIAPLDSVDATGNTIKVLGLTISVPVSALNGAQFHDNGGKKADDNGDGNGDNGGSGGTTLTLASFASGQIIRVILVSDVAPLTAVELSEEGAYDDNLKIRAPLQVVDTSVVTLLGLKIDISGAFIEGNNNDDSETVPTTPTMLAAGQIAEVSLDKTKLPALVALIIDIQNFTNQVEVQLNDNQGNEVGDDTQDTTVDATETVLVTNVTTGKLVKKAIHIHTTTKSGKVNLSGLLPGRAKLVIARHGKTYRKTVIITANGTATLKLKVGK